MAQKIFQDERVIEGMAQVIRMNHDKKEVESEDSLDIKIRKALSQVNQGVCPCAYDGCVLAKEEQIFYGTCDNNYKECPIFSQVSSSIRRRNLLRLMN